MKKYICLRDDDTNYYTEIDELQNAYGNIWGEIPVTLATIPFVHGSEKKILDYNRKKDKYSLLQEWENNASVDELTDYYKIHPIAENTALVEFLLPYVESELIEIAQHGVFHKYSNGGPEMFKERINCNDIRAGKQYLEKVFNTSVMTFIPPSNSIDPMCAFYLSELGMRLFSSGSIKYASCFDMVRSYIKDPLSISDKLFHKANSPLARRCNLYMFGGITINHNDTVQNVLSRISTSLNNQGFLAIGSHYRAFGDNEYKQKYYDVINTLRRDADVEFVTASRFYDLMYAKLKKER